MAKSNGQQPEVKADKPAENTAAEAAGEQKAKTPAFKPTIKKHVTLPLIKPQIGQPIYIKIIGEMYVGKDISKKSRDPSKTDMAPATLVNCVNLETGEESQIIVPSVLKGILEDEYCVFSGEGEERKLVEQDYVGRCFMLTKQPKPDDKKRYFPFTVAEIEDPDV